MTDSKYDAPMAVGDRLVVRVRRVALDRNFGGFRWVGFRLTHPHGRRSLAQNFITHESAEQFARDRGWTVLGGQS